MLITGRHALRDTVRYTRTALHAGQIPALSGFANPTPQARSRSLRSIKMISIPVPPLFPSALVTASFGVSIMLALPTISFAFGGQHDMTPVAVGASLSVLTALPGIFLWRYRTRHRNDQIEIHDNGIRSVFADQEELISWSDIERIAVNKSVARRIPCPSIRIQLKNGLDIRIRSPTGLAEEISVATSNAVAAAISKIESATRDARSDRINRELVSGGLVDFGGLSVSEYTIRAGKREIPWKDISRIERFLLIFNGHGTPSIQIYHQTKHPNRPYITVAEATVWDVDFVLPYALKKVAAAKCGELAALSDISVTE
jgi:hypothetical protein